MTVSKAGPRPRLAVLIDGDNASAAIVDGLLAEIAHLGIASVKRIYGDWTKPTLACWKDVLLKHAIHPVQQFAYATGKNATDCAMIIDAMDLLYTRPLDGFCIVSSDSDFTRLAARIREEGLSVYGFGERNTPLALVSACDTFRYTEDLGIQAEPPQVPQTSREPPPVEVPALDISPVKAEMPAKPTKAVKAASEAPLVKVKTPPKEASPAKAPPVKAAAAAKPKNTLKADTKLVHLLRGAMAVSSKEDGWAHLGVVTSRIKKQSPDFDSNSYGYKQLRDLVEAIDLFDMEERAFGGGGPKFLCIRDRKYKPLCGDETVKG